MQKYNKSLRILVLYDRISRNEIIYKQQAAEEFDVIEKTIYRDSIDLNSYFENVLHSTAKVIHNEKSNSYRLNNPLETKLTKEETLSLLKVILESRAFSKPDMDVIFDKLLNGLSYEDKKQLSGFYANEKDHYIETKNTKPLFQILWDMSIAVKERRIVSAKYQKITADEPKDIVIEPVGILFSEYYFYLLAFFHQEEGTDKYPNPAVFRLDNFLKYTVTENHYTSSPSQKAGLKKGSSANAHSL